MDEDQYSEKESRNAATRNRLSAEVTEILKEYFAISCKPSVEEREELANRTGLTPRVIQIWFQNRRSKLRREASDPSLFGNKLVDGVGRQAIEPAESLPAVTAKNFKEMCLPQYLDPPFNVDHNQDPQARRHQEAVKRFWREKAIETGLITETQPPQSSSKKRRTKTKSDTTSASASSTNNSRPSTAELLHATSTPVHDMPNLSNSASPSIANNYIPFQHIQPQLFHDPRTKRAYIPQLDSLTNNLDFLFTPTTSSQSHTHQSIPLSEQFSPIANNLDSIDFFSLFPEAVQDGHQF